MRKGVQSVIACTDRKNGEFKLSAFFKNIGHIWLGESKTPKLKPRKQYGQICKK